jgi:hypothetical protein
MITPVGGDTSDFLTAANDLAADATYTIFSGPSGLSGAGGWLEFDVSIPSGAYRPVFRGSSNYDLRAKLRIDGVDHGIFLGADSHGTASWIDAALDQGVIYVPTSGLHNVRVSEANGTAFFQGFPGLGVNYLSMKYLDLIPVPDPIAPSSGVTLAPLFTNASPIPVGYSASDAGGAGLAEVRLYYRYRAGAWIDTGLTATAPGATFYFSPAEGEGPYAFATVARDALGNMEALPEIPDRIVVYDVTPPRVYCPPNLTITSAGGAPVPRSDPRIAGFLDGFASSDNFTFSPALSHNAPLQFPVGATVVVFSAQDEAGNGSACSASVMVIGTALAAEDKTWAIYR